MDRYEDLTVAQRASLTEEQLEPYKAVALMEAGVVARPRPAIPYNDSEAERDEARQKWEENQRAVRRVVASIEEDWRECRAEVEAAYEVMATFDEYVKTASGDEELAARFLIGSTPQQRSRRRR